MKYIEVDKLKAEIERRKKICEGIFERESDTYYQGKAVAYGELLPFIDTLEEEPDKSLEEAANKFARFYDNGTCDGIAQDCFIAGAEWKDKQVNRDEVFHDGMRYAYDQLMKEAVEGVIKYYVDFGGILVAEAQVGSPYHCGDKVKVIVIKEE